MCCCQHLSQPSSHFAFATALGTKRKKKKQEFKYLFGGLNGLESIRGIVVLTSGDPELVQGADLSVRDQQKLNTNRIKWLWTQPVDLQLRCKQRTGIFPLKLNPLFVLEVVSKMYSGNNFRCFSVNYAILDVTYVIFLAFKFLVQIVLLCLQSHQPLPQLIGFIPVKCDMNFALLHNFLLWMFLHWIYFWKVS